MSVGAFLFARAANGKPGDRCMMKCRIGSSTKRNRRIETPRAAIAVSTMNNEGADSNLLPNTCLSNAVIADQTGT